MADLILGLPLDLLDGVAYDSKGEVYTGASLRVAVPAITDQTVSDSASHITLNEIYSQIGKLIKLQELQMLYIQEVTGLDFNKGDL